MERGGSDARENVVPWDWGRGDEVFSICGDSKSARRAPVAGRRDSKLFCREIRLNVHSIRVCKENNAETMQFENMNTFE